MKTLLPTKTKSNPVRPNCAFTPAQMIKRLDEPVPRKDSIVREINDLHNEIWGCGRTVLEKAIRIGELLTEQKGKLEHGEWLPWIRENLPFEHATVSRYMGIYDRRVKISHREKFGLTAAYRLLSEGSSGPPPKVISPKAAACLPELEAIIEKDLDRFNTGLSAIREYLDLGGHLSTIVAILKNAGVQSEVILIILELASEASKGN